MATASRAIPGAAKEAAVGSPHETILRFTASIMYLAEVPKTSIAEAKDWIWWEHPVFEHINTRGSEHKGQGLSATRFRDLRRTWAQEAKQPAGALYQIAKHRFASSVRQRKAKRRRLLAGSVESDHDSEEDTLLGIGDAENPVSQQVLEKFMEKSKSNLLAPLEAQNWAAHADGYTLA